MTNLWHVGAAKTVDMGGGNNFTPMVLGPSAVPEITDEAEALADPELAVLSAMAHGDDEDSVKAAKIACAAQVASRALDEERSRLYFDLIMLSLSNTARQALQTMNPARYEYKSDFARGYMARGRGELIIRLLTLRFGSLSEDAQARILAASIAEQDAIGERLLTARSLQEALQFQGAAVD